MTMFDVSWTDPSRETVGQRRSRKEQNGLSDSKPRGASRASSMRSARSSESSPAQVKPSLLNLFGAVKKGTLSRSELQSKVDPKVIDDHSKSSHRLSTYTVESESSAPDNSGFTTTTTRIPVNGFFSGGPWRMDNEQSSPSDVSESVISGWTEKSKRTESTWSSTIESTTSSSRYVTPTSPKSFVTQLTEATASPRASMKAAEQVATVVHIAAAGSVPIQVQDSPTKSSSQITTFDFPLPSLGEENDLYRDMDVCSVGSSVRTRGRNSSSWKPAETWNRRGEIPNNILAPRLLEVPFRPSKLKRSELGSKRGKTLPTEIAHLQRSLRRMEAASKKIILERLKEEWVEVADASVYKELEIEKQLWMLTALRRFQNIPTSIEAPEFPSGVTRVLSLYENHASCTSLSATTKAEEVHHLSTNPVSPKAYPNVHPVMVPGATSHLPYGPNTFSSIHAFCLPALLPASSMQTILKECHRTLVSAPRPVSRPGPTSFSTTTPISEEPNAAPKGGILHLTILDPSPLPATLGPRLRTWLDDHLILNLEKQFRCINPGRLFPDWLAEAGLRAEGSTIIYVKFLASVPSAAQHVPVDGEVTEEATKLELKSVVGRMLWKEMWGSYVQGDKWWWEDQNIVDECERMGTAWEYAVIEAVKGN